MSRPTFVKASVLAITLLITALFFAMVKPFLVTFLLAAIFSGLSQPLYRGLERLFRGKRSLASLTTLIIVLLIVIVPLLFLVVVAANQAIEVSHTVRPWVEQQLAKPDPLARVYDLLPILDDIGLDRKEVLTKVMAIVQGTGHYFVSGVAGVTGRTANFLFHFFLFGYCMYFLLKDGQKALDKFLYYLPLSREDEMKMMSRFVSVGRAMLRGTLAIGLLQGLLGGIGFWVAGLHGPVFWGALMVVLSVVPGVGTGLIWVPAVIYLAVAGHLTTAILLTLWFLLIVGAVDNLLRPLMAGKDTQMHQLMILFGTLGGLSLFGIPGLLLGPILAAVCLTLWEIYGQVYHAELEAQ